MAFSIDTAQELIGQLYVGYGGRAADPAGLNYWVQQLEGGMSLVAIANSFAVQPEAKALYPYLAAPSIGGPVAFITAIYQDLFNRSPDAAGLNYWVNQLTVQGTPPGQMVLNVISGAQGSDKTAIENKTHVAVDYAQKFVDNNLTWNAIDHIAGAHNVVALVTSDPATVAAAILQIEGISTSNLDFSGTLLPGQVLIPLYPGGDDTLTLLGLAGVGGDIADGVIVGFENLAIPAGFTGALSIAQWNDFYANITGGGNASAAYFRDGRRPFENTLTILNQIDHYNFSKLTVVTGALTVNTQAFLGAGPHMQAGTTLIATDLNDTFNFDDGDLDDAMKIDGGKGANTLNVGGVLTFGNVFGQVGDAGTTDAVVLNVENLSLLGGTNNVGFNTGAQFTKVIGGSDQDTIRNPEALVDAWFIDVMGGSGVSTNIIQVNSKAANLTAGTIQATGGLVALDIAAGGPSNTTMTFQQYQLFESSVVGATFGIIASGGSTFGNTTVTFTNQITGSGALLDENVGNWVFASTDDTFSLGGSGQSIDVSSGGADTVVLNLTGQTYDGTWRGGSPNDTIVFGANLSIAGVNGGGPTTFTIADFTNSNRNVTMTSAQHNSFVSVVAPGASNTITLSDFTENVTGLENIENYTLAASTGALAFTLSDSQTGTITGSVGGDIIKATGEQMRVESLKIDAKGGGDTLMITTDARNVDLQTRTTAIGTYHLLAGSTKNVIGANGDNITVSATGNTIFTMGSAGASQNYIGGIGGSAGIDQVTFNVGSDNINTGDLNDTVTSLVGGALTGIYNGGAGAVDTLSLTNSDDITGATVVNFENLVLANNASVKMTATQYGQFTSFSAAGMNTVILDTTGAGIANKTLSADIENWTLLDGAASAYTITGNNQFVTDLRNVQLGQNQATIAGGLTGVTLLASGGVGYAVSDNGGGTNHAITILGGSGFLTLTVVSIGGVHTGLSVQLSQDFDDLAIQANSKIVGTLDGGATNNDSLRPGQGADISEATFSNFEHLYIADGVRLSSDLWDQFVGTDGKVNSLSKSVQGSSLSGPETIDMTTTEFNITTAFSGTKGSTLIGIEGYILSNPGNDFLRVNTNYIDSSNVYVAKVNLSGGGTDFIVLNDTKAAFSGLNVGSTLTNFGSGAGGDLVQIQRNGSAISSGGFQLVTADNTDVAQTTVVINSSSILMDGTWDQGEARTLLNEAIGMIATGTYTMTAYFAGATSGAYIMGVEIVNADNPSSANIDLIGILSSVGADTLTSNNFG